MKILTVEREARCRRREDFPGCGLPEVAFAGRSNVGKSSLINSLLHRRSLAAVSSTPGKTRSIDFFLVNKSFRLVDLPGYGYARVPEPVQREWKGLIESYFEDRGRLTGVVWILDIRRELSDLDRLLQGWMVRYGVAFFPVLTKADKLTHSRQRVRQRELQREIGASVEAIVFSAKTGEGKAALWSRVQAAVSRPLRRRES